MDNLFQWANIEKILSQESVIYTVNRHKISQVLDLVSVLASLPAPACTKCSLAIHQGKSANINIKEAHTGFHKLPLHANLQMQAA